MAKRKSAATSPDKFRVGQRVVMVFGPAAGWARANGEDAVVIAAKRVMSVWCNDLDGGNRKLRHHTERYAVQWRHGFCHIPEANLRAAYDGDELSTWDEFAKVTGINIVETIVAQPLKVARRRKERHDG